MTTKATKPVTIGADLYNDVLERLSSLHPGTPDYRGDDALAARFREAVEGDMCMDDGDFDGICSVHDDRIEYWVNDFGPDGKVICLGSYAPAVEDMATCFPVCPGAQAYHYDRVVRVGDPASV